MRFEKLDDCYLDTKTGLDWHLENAGPMPWREAIDSCEELSGGWRLPTIKELLSIVNYTMYDPATELPGMLSPFYWSSTTDAIDTLLAWSVYFYDGRDDWSDKSNYYYVRAVRG